jgi:hypothetical protein
MKTMQGLVNLAVMTSTCLVLAVTITGIPIQNVFASHSCAEPVGFFLIPVHDSDGNPAGCLPATDKKDCDENKEFKKECKDFFKDLGASE